MATSVVKLQREELVHLFTEMGANKAASWSDERMQENLLNFEQMILDGQIREPDTWTRKGRETFQEVLAAIQAEEMIDFSGDGESPSGGKANKDKGEYDLDEEDPGDEDEEDPGDEDLKQEEAPKRRGRPRKNPPAPKQPKPVEQLAPHRGFEILKYKNYLEKPTKKLAEEFSAMETFPKDRNWGKARHAWIYQALKNREFWGADWVSCYVKDKDTTYRLNGKHSSRAILEYLNQEEDPQLDFEITVREFTVPTLADAAGLFATMDDKRSARTKGDQLKGFSSANPTTAKMSDRLVNLATAGLAYALYEKKARKVPIADQAGLLITNPKFSRFLLDMVGEDALSKLEEPKKPADVKHLMRMSVIAAMYKTWRADPADALAFWSDIRDDLSGDKKDPRRVLYAFLTSNKVGKGGKAEHEVLVRSIRMWNAWRNNEARVDESKMRYRKDEPTPEVK